MAADTTSADAVSSLSTSKRRSRDEKVAAYGSGLGLWNFDDMVGGV